MGATVVVVFRITCHTMSRFRRFAIGEKLTNGGLSTYVSGSDVVYLTDTEF